MAKFRSRRSAGGVRRRSSVSGVRMRTAGAIGAVALLAVACAGPPDAARCAERLEVTATVPARVARAETSILFARTGPTGGEFSIYHFAGGTLRPVPGVAAAAPSDVDLSPDGTLLAVSTVPDGELVVVELGTGVSEPLGVTGAHPDWSPGGTGIAFTTSSGVLGVVVPGDRSVRWVRPIPDPGPLSAPSWSPDGTRVVVAADTDPSTLGSDELHIVDVASGAAVRVSRGVSLAAPAWAPDGTRIVHHDVNGLTLMCTDGGLRGRIVEDGVFPVWSPDGSEIVFTSTTSRWGEIGLFVVDDAGGTPFRVTEGEDVAVEWTPGTLP